MTGAVPETSGVGPVVAVGGVAVVEGSLLLVRRATQPQAGSWTIPGGHVEPGEPLASAVEREMLEETGLRVACGAVGWVERMGPGYHFVILDFTVAVPDGAAPPVAGGDAGEAAWVPLAEVPALSLVEGVEEFLRTHGVLE